jgi:hypothetical protein
VYIELFNIIFETGIIPDNWLVGYIKPICKNKRDKLDPKNVRPITILSCVSKLFTAILNERLNKFSDDFFYISNENQTGFRKGYSTLDNSSIVHSIFEILKKKKKKMYCCFIDFEKGSDKVVSSAYKGSNGLGIYQIFLQYPEKYCLDTLGCMSPRKTPNHSNIRQKGKGTYYHPVLSHYYNKRNLNLHYYIQYKT